MTSRTLPLLLTGFLLLVAACSDTTNTSGGDGQACTPDETQECTCADDAIGTSSCTADGLWGQCTCATNEVDEGDALPEDVEGEEGDDDGDIARLEAELRMRRDEIARDPQLAAMYLD